MQARNNRTRRKSKQSQNPRLGILALAAVIGLTGGIASAELVYRMAGSPRVGDIIVFDNNRQPTYGFVDGRVLAVRAGQAGCMLDTQAMRLTGGSLIVEQRESGRNPQVRIHWSGLRTTGDDQNCGADADLLLRSSDMAVLAAAAGGYGVVPQPIFQISWLDVQTLP